MSTSTKLAAAGAVASAAPNALGFHSGVSEQLNIGLVGCGGRGAGAVINAMKADSNTQLTALADAFPDRIEECYRNLDRSKFTAGRMNVDEQHKFTGFSCYKDLAHSDVDVVLLATPPHFRPAQMAAAIDAGKHVFCEKPVAVDAPGVRSILESCKKAKERGLSVVSGLCWRYDLGVNETIKRIKDGEIGDIKTIEENYLTGTLWHRGNNPKWSAMEYQLRNWLYYTWLSGDHIAEQHIHSLDKALWLMNDQPPATCYGTGGRLVRTDKKWGNVYDHFSCCFEWENGVKVFSNCRQMAGCFNDVDDYVIGTEGNARILRNEIVNSMGDKWKYDGPSPSMYDVEHQHLFRSIRQGKPINDGHYMSYSTLMAIMGREACYTGKKVKWDDIYDSETRLGPEEYEWGDYKPASVAKPGDPFG